ncbi:MAG: DUF929 domain-containing protein [Thermoplasmata archaeon]|nr:DUF929 domain-containing protein [Thermoplasmata archaeon]
MVDWDRVEQLRSKGWDWDEIAEDPKVAFQADSGSGEPGRALRVLYHRRRSKGTSKASPDKKGKQNVDATESRWTLLRVGYVLVPVLAVWFAVAYLAPSPVGLVLPAIPYVALGLAVAAFILIYSLLRAERRWTKVYRNTVIGAIVLGLVFTGVVTLAGNLIFGCPYLPPASALSSQPGPGWIYGSMTPWQDGGKPVVYFYGSTWCPFCSAGSWTIWKALSEFGTVSGTQLTYSSPSDVYAETPEIVLANAQVTSSSISFQVNEDSSGVRGTFPPTIGCYAAAYFGAYAGGGIPFLVVNGRAVHVGALINPAGLGPYTLSNSSTGNSAVFHQVQSENGTAWNAVSGQSYWIMAYIAKALGATSAPAVAALAKEYSWSPSTTTAVTNYVAQIS